MRLLFPMESAFVLALLCPVTTMVAQQQSGPYGPNGPNGYGQYEGGYRNDQGYRRGFDDGMRSGQTDMQSGKRSDPTKSENYEDTPGYNSSYGDKGQWRQQYRQGYTAGYQRAMDAGANRGYGQTPYSQGGYGQPKYADDQGYRRGFDDGMRSGQTDMQSGKRSDPTKSENYEDTPGYNSSYGDKGQWRQQYRQGYTVGYQRALGGGSYGQYGGAIDGRRYDDDDRSRNRGFGYQNATDPAYQRGYQDGMSDGQNDVRRNRRNADLTKSEHYGDAPGYNSSYGSKDQWKATYRQGYAAGYRRAWETGESASCSVSGETRFGCSDRRS